MSGAANLIEKFRLWPRVLQWVALAAIGMALFLIWDNFIRGAGDALNRDAERMVENVQKIRRALKDTRDLNDPEMNGLVTAIGPVRAPLPSAEGAKLFNQVVLDVLQKNGISNANFSSRSRGKMGKATLVEVTQGLHRVDRLTGDLKFDATPKTAAAIIAELESSPYVDSVNSLRMTRDAGGKIKVALTIEAWILIPEAAGESA